MSEQPCAFHPDRLTMVSCSHCERPICTDDMIPAPVGIQCPICAGRMREGAIGEASYKLRTKAENVPGVRAVVRSEVTRVLLGINIAAFLLVGLRGMIGKTGSLLDPTAQLLARSGALVLPLPRAEIWRMLTAMFLHVGLIHIAMNMYALLALGRSVETRYGKMRYLGLYLSAGLAGSAASIAFHHPVLPAGVGASGAIFGIFGSLFAFVIMNRNLPGTRALLNNLILLVVINGIFAFAVRSIDSYAHIGGMIGGFAIALAFEFSRRLPGRKPAAVSAAACLIVAALSIGVALGKTCSPSSSTVATVVGPVRCDQIAKGEFG